MHSAVLFLVFNRPETTARVFEAIRAARPPRLYVAADGPRRHRPSDADLCAQVRAIATAVDWPCDLRTRLREDNLGCATAVSQAIDWFFDHEPQGIILEDDVLPVPSFFPFVEELLDRYADDERVGMVSGNNFVAIPGDWTASYFFSAHVHIWGWGCWARSWRGFDLAMRDWPRDREAGLVERMTGGRPRAVRHFRQLFDDAHANPMTGWDAQLCHHLWRSGQLCALPRRNLTEHIGVGSADAAHLHGPTPSYQLRARPTDTPFPLVHVDPVAGWAHDPQVERDSLRLRVSTDTRRMVRRLLGPAFEPLRRAARAVLP